MIDIRPSVRCNFFLDVELARPRRRLARPILSSELHSLAGWYFSVHSSHLELAIARSILSGDVSLFTDIDNNEMIHFDGNMISKLGLSPLVSALLSFSAHSPRLGRRRLQRDRTPLPGRGLRRVAHGARGRPRGVRIQSQGYHPPGARMLSLVQPYFLFLNFLYCPRTFQLYLHLKHLNCT